MSKALVCVALVFLTAVAAGAAGSAMRIVTVHAPNADLRAAGSRRDGGAARTRADGPHLDGAARGDAEFVLDSDAGAVLDEEHPHPPGHDLRRRRRNGAHRISQRGRCSPPALPDDGIPRESGIAKYVIELGANEAERDGIRPSVRLDIPALRAP